MSAETKWTPGPWEADGPLKPGPAYRIRNVWGLVCYVGDPVTASYDRANANLIAAAPELYEALEGLVSIIDRAGLLNLSNGVQLGQTSWLVKASGAREYGLKILAKARGESAVKS